MKNTTEFTGITTWVTVTAAALGAFLSYNRWGGSLPAWEALLLGVVGGTLWGLGVMWGLKAYGRWSKNRAAKD